MDYPEFEAEMLSGLEEMGIRTEKEEPEKEEPDKKKTEKKKIELLFKYQDYLLQENKHYNLTAITDPEEVLRKHYLDSLTLLSAASFSGRAKMIDVGTGAGFPGLVIKIFCPELELLLLDSQKKRVNFLRELIERLQISGVEVIHGRAEELAREEKYREEFDWVVSRAVAPLNILSEYTLPFSRPGGQTVLYKGPAFEQEIEELAQGKGAIFLLGGEIRVIKNVKVPGLEGERYLVFISKTGVTPPKYPRRPGIPKKRPL